MDFLADSISSPTVLFLNSKITDDGIIPDMGYLSSGNHSEEVVLFDKNGYKVCKIKLPSFIIRAPLRQDWTFYNNQNEFIITEVYENR
jgi:hypothetical protein